MVDLWENSDRQTERGLLCETTGIIFLFCKCSLNFSNVCICIFLTEIILQIIFSSAFYRLTVPKNNFNEQINSITEYDKNKTPPNKNVNILSF